MVISGGDFKPDALKAKDMVSLLLHDDEMETRCKYCPASLYSRVGVVMLLK